MVSDRRTAAPPNPAITGPARREPGPARISGDRPDAGSLGRVPARSAAGSGAVRGVKGEKREERRKRGKGGKLVAFASCDFG